MDPNTFPTKGNLILAKNSLKLAHMGYELMDKKRNILIRELMGLIDEAKDIQRQIDVTFREAYAALQIANMEIGITNVQTVSYTVPVEESIRIKTRSIMGVEIPLVEADQSGQAPTYAYYSTKESLDPLPLPARMLCAPWTRARSLCSAAAPAIPSSLPIRLPPCVPWK